MSSSAAVEQADSALIAGIKPPADAGGSDFGDAPVVSELETGSVEPLLTCGLLTGVAEVGEFGAELVDGCWF